VTDQRAVVAAYMDGFRTSDHEAILGCLTDDVVWRIHGHRTTSGKAEFDAEIEGEGFEGRPVLTVDRTYEDGDVVIITGEGRGSHREQGPFSFVFTDLFTFRDGLIAQVDSYVVPIA
jgi:ketosteroid isomerase-like protein